MHLNTKRPGSSSALLPWNLSDVPEGSCDARPLLCPPPLSAAPARMHFVLSRAPSSSSSSQQLATPGCALPAFFLLSRARSPRRAIPLYSDLLFILAGKYHGRRVPETETTRQLLLARLALSFTRAHRLKESRSSARLAPPRKARDLVALRHTGTAIHVGESDSESRFTRLKDYRERDNSRASEVGEKVAVAD